MKQHAYLIVGTLVLLLSWVGCTPRRSARPVAPAPQTPETGRPETRRRPGPPAGALQLPEIGSHKPGSLRPYHVSADLHEVSNLRSFEQALPLTPEQRRMLAKQLFAAGKTDYRQLFHVYENNEYHNLPSFVTTDVALHLYHCFFDYALRTIEQEKLLPLLERLTVAALSATEDMLTSARTPEVRDALIRNAAYFGVAARHLGLRVSVPRPAAALVEREAALMESHTGFARGAVFPYRLDYSQFVPRGHYTRSAKLRRLFMALMWYGLAPFATHYADGRPCPGAVRQGILAARALERGRVLIEWGRIYEATAHFAGAADDHIPPQWISVADRTFGRDGPPDALGDTARLNQFVAEVQHLPQPRIRAQMTLQPDMPSPTCQLRLMGQRYIPDSEMLQRLSRPLVRPFPAGLDVMAVLGSRRALEILDGHSEIYNAGRWREYPAERSRLIEEFSRTPLRRWTSNLYWSWLHALRPLLSPVPAGYPSFMDSSAWQDKSLHTALASWAELRHDTILYGKQSAVECGDGEERPTPTGYVEPNAPLYERLLALLTQTRAIAERNQLMTPALKTGFEGFEGFLKFLRRCSEKELRGELLTDEENEEIRYIGGKIEFLVRSTIEGQPPYWELVDKGDQDMAVIADVHTAPPKVLQEGVGRAGEILVIVPIGKKLILTRGAILTYYEFTHPISNRLTDEKWRTILDTPDAPDSPVWTRSFLVPAAPSDPRREKMHTYSSGC